MLEIEEYIMIRELHTQGFSIRDNILTLSENKNKGQKVGRLRHKPRHSMIYEQSGFKIDDLGYLRLSKIRAIPIIIS
jgi:hypothetical protein